MTAKLFVFPTPEPPLTRKRKRRRKSAELFVFPYSRRLELVKDHARAIRELTPKAQATYLEKALVDMCEEVAALGFDCEECLNAAVDDLATAIGRQLHGPGFQLRTRQREEAAR
jgi:hypothetical protein